MKKLYRKLLQSLLCAVALTAVSLSGAQAQTVVVPMLACPLGCGIVLTQTALAAQMARAGSDILPAAQETPGFMYNVRVMANESRWETTVFGTEEAVIQAAAQGGTEGLKKFVPEEIPINWKLLYGEGIVAQGSFFVTFNPEIKSIADLKGKRVAIGLLTQSDWGMMASLLLEHGYGITAENTDIRHVTPPVMTQQLIDGNVDAILMALITNADGDIWWTNSLTSRLEASGQTIRYLPVTEEAIAAVNEEFDMTLLNLPVPAGTLPDQQGEFLAAGNRIFEAVHPSFPENVAYKLVKAVAEFGPKLRESGQGLWKFWSKTNMVAGLSEENAHPGAIKAYKELGWWEMRKDFDPVTYPEK